MLEKHRLTYLDSLGIENYMPRFQLPHALPSKLLSDEALQEPTAFSTADLSEGLPTELPKESSGGSTEGSAEGFIEELLVPSEALIATAKKSETPLSHVNIQDNSSAQAAPRVNTLMESLGIQREEPPIEPTDEPTEAAAISTVANTSPDTPTPDADTNTAPAEVRFTLNVWRIREELIVIDSRQPAAALPTEKLLQNILRSVGYPLAQLPPSELLRWPLFTNKKLTSKNITNKYIDQSSEEEEARAMVQAYLSAQYAKAPVKALLLLGQSAVQFALTPDTGIKHFYAQHKGSQISSSPWQSQVLVAPSLVDMLHDPMQKRVTWQALQVLLHSQV
ncbi:MAG: hypothetical protein ACI8VC_002240 [Candidatus Endobugula sp.]|jgi:hypothetical protein